MLEDFTNKMCRLSILQRLCMMLIVHAQNQPLISRRKNFMNFYEGAFFLKKENSLDGSVYMYFFFDLESCPQLPLLGKFNIYFLLIQMSFVTCMSRTLTKFCSVLIWSLLCWLVYSQTEWVFSPPFVLNYILSTNSVLPFAFI